MAKGQMKPQREKRKPKTAGGKKKTPSYMSGASGMSSAKPEPLKVAPKK